MKDEGLNFTEPDNKISELREKFRNEQEQNIAGWSNADEVFEWFKPYLKIPSIDWEGLENSAQLAKVRIKNLFNDGNDSDRIDFAFDQLFEKLQDYIK